jgi:hypothetical protein
MHFYQNTKPTTAEFLEAIEKMDYFTIEQLETKRKQIRIMLEDEHKGEVLIGFTNITNTGGYPIIFCANDSVSDVLEEFNNEMPDDDEVELFSYSIQAL